MLDPIIQFFQNIFSAIGRGIGYVIAWLLFPFMSAGRWYASRGFILKSVVGALVLLLFTGYVHLIYNTQAWTGFDPDFVNKYKIGERKIAAGVEIPNADGTLSKKCQTSAIVDVATDLIDMEVNQNLWISSSPLYKAGLFGMDWDHTPFLDNKAAFQRGVNETLRTTTVELVNSLARVRGTSGINNNLQSARSNLQYSETAWYVSLSPVGFLTPTPKIYNEAIKELRAFNIELGNCQAIFDGRADNLLVYLDRITSSLGGTASQLKDRSENYNAGWFDTRADDRFWFAYGQMYGYYAILTAARADFSPVISEKNLAQNWNQMLGRFRSALRVQPSIISNGREDGWIMPNHLSTQGFYLLNAHSSLREIRDVLDR